MEKEDIKSHLEYMELLRYMIENQGAIQKIFDYLKTALTTQHSDHPVPAEIRRMKNCSNGSFRCSNCNFEHLGRFRATDVV